jgi:tape measure domain-containing protein
VSDERLVVQLEARITQFEKNFAKARATANRDFKAVEDRSKQAASRIESSMSAVGGRMVASFGAVGAAVGGALSVTAIAAAAKKYVDLTNTLKVAGLEGRELEKVFAGLYQIAQRNGTPLDALATLYSRAAQAQGELKASSADLMQFTNGVSLALRVAGTDSTQAAGALLQLSQALGSGTVKAEEFNSINEGARPILQAVAAGAKEAGGSVATLKNLVNDGKVSSEAFFKAFLAGMPTLAAQASKTQGTVAQATSRVSNAFTVLIGKLDETVGASEGTAKGLTNVATVLEGLPAYLRAASKGFNDLQSWMTRAGNHPVWEKVARLSGVKFTAEEGIAAGVSEVPGAPDAQRYVKLTQEITDWEKQLADARQTAAGTGLAIDRDRAELIEQRIRLLTQERDAINATTRAIVDSHLATTPKNSRIPEFGLSPEGRAPAPQPVKPIKLADFAAKKEADTTRHDQIESYIAELEKSSRVLQAEFATLGKSNAERHRAIELAKIGTVTDDKQLQKLTATVDANEVLRTKIEAVKKAQEGLKDAAKAAGDAMTDGLADVLIDGKSVQETIDGLIRQFARLALQAAFMGSGSFGGLTGTGGGIFGAIGTGLSGMFSGGSAGFGSATGAAGNTLAFGGPRARGGPVSPNMAYLVGEYGPEVIAPRAPGTVIPNHALGRVTQSNVINVNVSGGGGGSGEQNEDLAKRIGAQVEAQMKMIAQKEIHQQTRQGGMLARGR